MLWINLNRVYNGCLFARLCWLRVYHNTKITIQYIIGGQTSQTSYTVNKAIYYLIDPHVYTRDRCLLIPVSAVGVLNTTQNLPQPRDKLVSLMSKPVSTQSQNSAFKLNYVDKKEFVFGAFFQVSQKKTSQYSVVLILHPNPPPQVQTKPFLTSNIDFLIKSTFWSSP